MISYSFEGGLFKKQPLFSYYNKRDVDLYEDLKKTCNFCFDVL